MNFAMQQIVWLSVFGRREKDPEYHLTCIDTKHCNIIEALNGELQVQLRIISDLPDTFNLARKAI